MNDEQYEYKMINVQVTVEEYEDPEDKYVVPEQKFVIPVKYMYEKVAKNLAAYIAPLFPNIPPRITLEYTEKYKVDGEYEQVKITLCWYEPYARTCWEDDDCKVRYGYVTEEQYNKLQEDCDHCGRRCEH